jgi:hypothetical protein
MNRPQSGEWLSEQVTGTTPRFASLLHLTNLHPLHPFCLLHLVILRGQFSFRRDVQPPYSTLQQSDQQHCTTLLSPKVPSYQDVVVGTNGEQARGPARCTSDRNRQQRKARLFPRRVGAALRTAHQCRGLMKKKNLRMGDYIDTR